MDPTPIPLRKPGRAVQHRPPVELYEAESDSTAVAEPDSSVVKMLHDVEPKCAFPSPDVTFGNIGDAVNRVVVGISQAGRAVGDAVSGATQSLTSGSGDDSYHQLSGANPPSQ